MDRTSSTFNFMGGAARNSDGNATTDRTSNPLPRYQLNEPFKNDASPRTQKKSAETRQAKSIDNNEVGNEKPGKFESKLKQRPKINDVKEKLNPKVYSKTSENETGDSVEPVNVTHNKTSSILQALQPKPQDTKSPPTNINTNNNLEIDVSPKEKVNKDGYDEQQWKELRKLYLIPDYEFPLDTVSRPGYDDVSINFPQLNV